MLNAKKVRHVGQPGALEPDPHVTAGLMPSRHSTTSPTGASAGVMILPEALRLPTYAAAAV